MLLMREKAFQQGICLAASGRLVPCRNGLPNARPLLRLALPSWPLYRSDKALLDGVKALWLPTITSSATLHCCDRRASKPCGWLLRATAWGIVPHYAERIRVLTHQALQTVAVTLVRRRPWVSALSM